MNLMIEVKEKIKFHHKKKQMNRNKILKLIFCSSLVLV